MEFNPEQSKAIFSDKPLVLISAGAGSGKTRVLTERFIHLCKEKLTELKSGQDNEVGAEVKEIVAITFTEKAAREMKKRIRDRINEELSKLDLDDELSYTFWKDQRESLDTGLITTFHSFCHKILHQFAFKANLSPNFMLVDETQATLLKNQCFNEILLNEKNHKKWKLLYSYYSKADIKGAVLAIYNQIQENPQYKTVQDFFEEFSAEDIIKLQSSHIEGIRRKVLMDFYMMTQECIKSFPSSSTLKGKAKEHVEKICASLEGLKFEDLSTDEFLDILKIIPGNHRSYEKSAPSLYQLCGEYKTFKETVKKYNSLPEDRIDDMCKVMALFIDVLSSFQRIYKQKKDERASLDFSDLQKMAIGLLAEHEEVRDFCRREFKHMMVDEFQDTNGLQMKMLEYINPRYRFIVGDGKQSIYRFRGADVTLMNSLEGVALKEEQADFIDMGRNYRNCDSIIQFVNELFKVFMVKDGGSFNFGIDYKPLISNRQDEFETHPHKKVELVTLEKSEDEEDRFDCEFDMLTERMLELYNSGEKIVKGKVMVDGVAEEMWKRPNWKDFAILIPSRTGLTALEKNLKNKNIPFVVHGGIGFYQKQEVKDLLNILRFINRPWEKVYILAVLRSPLFQLTMDDFLEIHNRIPQEDSLGDYIYSKAFEEDTNLTGEIKTKLQRFYQLYQRFVPFVPQTHFADSLVEIFEESGLKLSLLIQKNPLQLVKNVEKLIDIMAGQSTHSLEELLEQVDILASLSDKEGEAETELPEGNMVHIMTVHASKGLEFPIVCLPKLNRTPQKDKGYFFYDDEYCLVAKYKQDSEDDPFEEVEYSTPSYGLVKDKFDVAAFEETKRLFYVATTRARDYLLMTSKGKEANQSWYSMINTALQANPHLSEYIIVKGQGDISEQNKHEEDQRVFVSKNDIAERQLPFTFSVSEIMLYMNDPLKYYNSYILKVNSDWLVESEEDPSYDNEGYVVAGTEFGTIVHRACELYDQGFSEEEAVLEALESIVDGEEDTELPIHRDRLKRGALKMLASYKKVRDVDMGEHMASEWSFATELSGAYVVGEIDKVFKGDGGYHLMDLKTNILRDEDNLMESYMPQIYLYKLAYEQEMGTKVDEVSLFFMRAGKEGLKTFKADPSYEDKVKAAITEMSRLKRMNAGRSYYVR